MIRYMGKKVTPTQFAKLILGDYAERAMDAWSEDLFIDDEALTDREVEEIEAALLKQRRRIDKLLGYDELLERFVAE